MTHRDYRSQIEEEMAYDYKKKHGHFPKSPWELLKLNRGLSTESEQALTSCERSRNLSDNPFG